jgi:hypothetical protein
MLRKRECSGKIHIIFRVPEKKRECSILYIIKKEIYSEIEGKYKATN